ncbi:hypothetical protein [Methylophaga pinxianii]
MAAVKKMVFDTLWALLMG